MVAVAYLTISPSVSDDGGSDAGGECDATERRVFAVREKFDKKDTIVGSIL